VKDRQPTSLWIPPGELAVIDAATAALKITRSAFLRDAGLAAARGVLGPSSDRQREADR
jgi:hypothetical protein